MKQEVAIFRRTSHESAVIGVGFHRGDHPVGLFHCAGPATQPWAAKQRQAIIDEADAFPESY
jgi:hypothetical protein